MNKGMEILCPFTLKNCNMLVVCFRIIMNIEKIPWNILHVLPIRILVMARTILSVSHESDLINMTVEKIFLLYIEI